jgi:hypothetical protein
MAGIGKIATVALALAALAITVGPGEAQTAKRHLQCFAVPPIGVGGLLGGTQIQQRAIITNNTANAIAANTAYSYSMSGRQFSYTSQAALAPGQQLNVPGLYSGNATSCDAWITVRFGGNFGNVQGVIINPGAVMQQP